MSKLPPPLALPIVFNASTIASTMVSLFSGANATSFSPSEKRTASRALLRHQIYANEPAGTIDDDGDSKGLGRMYKQLHGKGNAKGVELKEIKSVLTESFNDVLEAVRSKSNSKLLGCKFTEKKITILDRIDGGITLMLRCPGLNSNITMALENTTVDVYVSPRELVEGRQKFSERVAILVQEFGANLALPHLLQFQTRCLSDRVKPLPLLGAFYFPLTSSFIAH